MQKPDALVFSVRLESGGFESSVRVPLGGQSEMKLAVERWLDLMATGLRTGATFMNAELDRNPRP